MYDLAIIGGGPAGLTAAIYALRAGKKVVLFEGNALGGTLNQIEKIENYPGYNSITGKYLAQKISKQAIRLGLRVIKQFVSSIFGEKDDFTIISANSDFRAKRVIYCGGKKRNTLKCVTDFGGTGISYCAECDGFFFRGKTVAVVGSGYAATESVQYLKGICKKVYLIGKIPGLDVEQFDDTPVEILGQNQVRGIRLKGGEKLDVDGVFIALGTQNTQSIFGEEVEMRDGEIKPGLFVSGDAGSDFKQIIWACASGARAAHLIFK